TPLALCRVLAVAPPEDRHQPIQVLNCVVPLGNDTGIPGSDGKVGNVDLHWVRTPSAKIELQAHRYRAKGEQEQRAAYHCEGQESWTALGHWRTSCGRQLDFVWLCCDYRRIAPTAAPSTSPNGPFCKSS